MMKKKALTVILSLCVAMALTACSGNAETTEVEETAVVADAQAEAEAEEQEEAVESEQTENEASADEESSEEIESGDEFPIIEQAVIDNDKSDEYGVYSTSCFDLDEFLDDNGELPGSGDWENTDWDTYTGRWAYPEITPCQFFDELTLSERSDKSEVYWVDGFTMFISSGLWVWNWKLEDSMDPHFAEYEACPRHLFTAQTADGETDVLVITDSFKSSGLYAEGEEYNEDEVEWTEYKYNTYVFHIGNFTVELMCDSGEWSETGEAFDLSEDDIQLIIDNIHLTDGTE